MMIWVFSLALLVGGRSISASPTDDCEAAVEQLQLPLQIKTEGKPKRLRWGDVNQLFPRLREALQSRTCQLTFEQVFQPKSSSTEVFFPILDSLLRTVPEDELAGLPVYYLDGVEAGAFSNRVILEKSRYKQYYFQFLSKSGNLETSRRDLIDLASGDPVFLLRWQDLRGKRVISGESLGGIR